MSEEWISLQRRSVKLEVKLTPFVSFSAFEDHVRTQFEIGEEAEFVITDFDRETVVDDAVYKSLRSGEYWTRNPKANRLFLVLDNISSPLEADVDLEVSYEPHFNTITKTGDANFSKIPHAVAELIDNSIQATNSNPEARKVEVEVELGGGGASFLVVRDNGRGMNASGLKDFATYFLTQENRGVSGPHGPSLPSSTGSQANGHAGGGGGGNAKGKGKASGGGRRASNGIGKRRKGKICSGFISKFGVGALQAGFYIGSSLRVVTKTAKQPDVYEFVMDEVEFERRAKANAAMFRDNIKLRNAGNGKKGGPESEVYGPAKELMDRLRMEESGKSHFTYIVLTLRDQHVEWFANHEKGCLKRELASIYHYYLHPEHCPDGIQRDDVFSGEETESSEDMENGVAGGGALGNGPLEIAYTQRNRNGQVAERTLLANIDDDLGSRLNAARKDSFRFDMEILHPVQSSKSESKRLHVTGVIHYYPYDGEKETRPRARPGEEDDESITIEAFWEGRLVPESHAAALSFFPMHKLKKKEREALGTSWKRRIKGMLFFDWHFPISNNKLRLQFPEGDLYSALNAKNIPPKHPAVIYPGSRGRQIEKDFRDWLIKCHEALDIEYRFDDKMQSAAGARCDKWRKMTFGKGGATFVSDSRVKLPFLKPNVYGVINYFVTEVDEDEEEGRGHGRFSLSRWPEEVYGEEDSALYPVTELDPQKSMINEHDWDREMATKRKQLPARLDVRLRTDGRAFPKKLTTRTGKEKMTGVQVQIFDGFKKPVVQISQGKQLRVHSILEQPVGKTGKMETAVKFTAKPFTDKNLKYDKMFFFDPMNMKFPGEYRWTMAVTKEGFDVDDPENRILALRCLITVLPGNPTKLSIDMDDWETRVPLDSSCWLPAFTVKLRDSSKCVCPMRSYGTVTVTCTESGAFDVVHAGSGSATHRLGDAMSESPGPLEYDDRSWRLEPKQTGLLSAATYKTRAVEFGVSVEANLQNDTQTEDDHKVFKSSFDVTFVPGAPSELMLLDPPNESDGSPVATVESGSKLSPLSIVALDAGGNRTAPSQNEDWQVTLDISAAAMGAADAEDPDFATSATEKVSGGVATLSPVVKWNKTLRQDGELAVVDATLSVGRGSREQKKEVASASFTIRVRPSKDPTEAVVCLGGKPWPSPSEAERFAASAEAAAGTGAAKAADSVGVRRSYQAGSVISALHLRLFDQSGSEVKIDKDTFDASNKKAVTCSWNAAWQWPIEGAERAGRFDQLPDLKVPGQISSLNGGLNHASVVLHPRLGGGQSTITLHATFAFAVHAGPVARWMAVRADTGNISDQAGPLVMTAGPTTPKACQASFAKAVKGFLPVDDYGNLVKNVQRAPEISIEGMPNITLFPEHQCKLAKPTKPNGLYQFPRALNLVGPPCEGGHLLIRSPRADSGDGRGSPGGGGAGRGGTGNTGDDVARVLQLSVSIRAGPPARVLIRSPALGVEEFSSEIRATQLAGFKVDDLEVRLVDAASNLATIPRRGVKYFVSQKSASSTGAGTGGSSSRGKGSSSGRPKDLSKRVACLPSVEMPAFVLTMKLQKLQEEEAVERVSNSVALVVRAEGSELEGIEEARIKWIRQRTSAITAVHVAALTIPVASVSMGKRTRGSSQPAPQSELEEPRPLVMAMGQRGGRKVGVTRPVDGPLPTLVVWLETDNDSPFTPPAESLTFAMTTSTSDGARMLANLYGGPVSAPPCIGRSHAMMFKPKGDTMEQNVGDHIITCSYVEMRGMPSQGTPREGKEMKVEMVLRVVAGAPYRLVPVREDANLFHSLSASNQTSMGVEDGAARHARRLVEKTFRFTGNDRKGNMAGHINGPVRMRIANLEGVNVPPEEMPRLEMSDAEGYVLADPTATGVFLFEENWLEEGVGTREGDYRLVVDSVGDPELQPWSTMFHFDTDQRRLNSIREVKARLKPLEDKMDSFHATLHAAHQREKSARRQVESCVSELPRSLTASIDVDSQDYAACIEEAGRLLNTFEDEQRDRQSHRARPIKFDQSLRMRPEDEARINPIGYIVELGYVEDEYIAKLLSQKGGSKMKAVYVDTKRQLDMVRRAGAGGFCRETVATFRVPETDGQRRTSRPRNAAEIAEKRLPLPDVKERGFIDYLVNIIQLPDQNEELRDTLFSALYGSMVMFDTHDNAHEYQKKCKQRGKIGLPILVREDGASLERNGYMPPTKDPDSLNKLKMVYASMPATLTPEYAKTEQYIRQLKSLIVALQDLLSTEREVSRVHKENESQGWSADIDALQVELKNLVSGAVPSVGGSGVGGGDEGGGVGRGSVGGSPPPGGRSGSRSSSRKEGKGKRRGKEKAVDSRAHDRQSKKQRQR